MANMTDALYILDGSKRLHISNTLDALREIARIRPLQVAKRINADMFEQIIQASYNSTRNQVNANTFMNYFVNTTFNRQNRDAGKFIIIDEDLYNGQTDNNWVFGGKYQLEGDRLGMVLLSTARLANEAHARHVAQHELGHLFGAPNPRRRDTYECLGTHCADSDCIMHQEISLQKSIQQAMAAARNGGAKFCTNCEGDIRRY